jgi:hypothetical protein
MSVVTGLSGDVAPASMITVQIVDGRNGKPLAKVPVYINVDQDKQSRFPRFTTDQRGELQFNDRDAKVFGVFTTGIVFCGVSPVEYSIADTLATGLVSANGCGSSKMEAQRGRLILFARRATWLELFRN